MSLIQNLKEGSYFEVGSESNRNIYRVMKMYNHTIHTTNIKKPLNIGIKKIKHFEDTYNQKIYGFCIINKEQGETLLLSTIEERILYLNQLEESFNQGTQKIPKLLRIQRKKLINLKQTLINKT